MCRSVPQMAERLTLMSTSSGPTAGAGTSSSHSPGSRLFLTSAFIAPSAPSPSRRRPLWPAPPRLSKGSALCARSRTAVRPGPILPAMRDDILRRYERLRVPRYTSYPTAPQFTAAVDAAAYRAWLTALPAGTVLSLYLHVPFCGTLCWYCGCHTRITARYGPVAAYLERLEREIDLVAGLLTAHMAVGRIHWGGGTPTIAGPR